MKARGKDVVPRELAARDIEDAVAHYLVEGGARLALRFIDAVELAFRRLGVHAAAGPPRYANDLDLPGLRVWPTRGFPYLIFYVEHADRVDVWRVLHEQRDIPSSLTFKAGGAESAP